MNLFQTLLEAAFKQKPFDTKEELFSTLKSLLKDSGITPYSEKKTSQGVKPRGGYKMPEVIVNETITIDFDSVDDNAKHNFYSKLNSNKIDFTRNHSGLITIRLKDNVNSDDLLSDEAKEELTTDHPEIIGTLSQGVLNPETGKLKRSTSNAINKFNQHQKKIYDELIKHGLIYWKQQKTNYKLEKR